MGEMSAEIILSLAQARARRDHLASFPSRALAGMMEKSRRALALFQHHDGITGTAKDHVVDDYGRRLLGGLHDAKRVVAECANFLLQADRTSYSFDPATGPEFALDETRDNHNSLPEKPVLTLNTGASEPSGGQAVVLYNSLAQPRSEVVSVLTDWPYVEVLGPDARPLHSQVEPLWPSEGEPDGRPRAGVYSVKFVADLTGLAVAK
ncbi:hypothetical protein EGW08_012689 [Elysia chlorotica]|uniref:Glycoside hydrolase family 38 central domain-containing protein n=1 Tax=Elysia chlorotica TaxID=188477 RepID=A0A433TD90_ELYCH|nr:hypothetical protein EGW08_012689 [Elysia chlorotica]